MPAEEMINSQEMAAMEESVRPPSTTNSTHWGVKKFEEWCIKRNVTIDLKTVDVKVLADVLRRFYAEAKTNKGLPLSPSGIIGVRAALHRKITQAPISRVLNILTHPSFIIANNMVDTKIKLFRKTHNPKPKHKLSIEDGDMSKLREYFKMNLTSPSVLQHFVWFSLCYNFGRRGREGWRMLTKETFEFQVDDVGEVYVCQSLTEATKNHQQAIQDESDFSESRMYQITGDRLCPVAELKHHLENLNSECSALFQTINKTGTGFIVEPMGKNKLSAIMPHLSCAAKLSRRYTNHCVRATTITTLHRKGVPANMICHITQHNDERSLSHYVDQPTTSQKRSYSRILGESIRGEPSLQQHTILTAAGETSNNNNTDVLALEV